MFRVRDIIGGGKKKKGPHYGTNCEEWPVQISMTHGEAMVLQKVLGDVLAMKQIVGETGKIDCKLLSGLHRKVAKQRKRPVLFLTN